VSSLAIATAASQAAPVAGHENGGYVPVHYPPLSPQQGEQLGWKIQRNRQGGLIFVLDK